MFTTRLSLAAASILVLATVAAADPAKPAATAGEATAQVLLDTIRANRKALVAVNLALTDEQAKTFWPLYERYQQELGAIGDRVLGLIEQYQKDFATLSDEEALRLIRGYLDAEAERAKVRAGYVDEFAKILPGRTVARFFQIENKLDAVVRYDLAATIPVVETSADKK
jgi:hypothetical protein